MIILKEMALWKNVSDNGIKMRNGKETLIISFSLIGVEGKGIDVLCLRLFGLPDFQHFPSILL